MTPPRIQALHIVHAGLADVRLWLGEITPEQHAADTYQPRHAKETR